MVYSVMYVSCCYAVCAMCMDVEICVEICVLSIDMKRKKVNMPLQLAEMAVQSGCDPPGFQKLFISRDIGN